MTSLFPIGLNIDGSLPLQPGTLGRLSVVEDLTTLETELRLHASQHGIAALAGRLRERWRKPVVVVGVGVWAFNGPLQPGWARAAGTPPDLLRSP